MNKFATELYKKNREKLTKLLKPNSLLIICSSAQSMRTRNLYNEYRQSSNMIYLTGIFQEETTLLIYNGSSKNIARETLFIRYNDEKTLIWEGHKLSKKEASEISGISNVMWQNELGTVLQKVISTISIIYLELGDEFASDDKNYSLSYNFSKKIIKKYPSKKFNNYKTEKAVPLINEIRMVKEKKEIEIISEAINITHKTFIKILPKIKPGIFENDIEAEITRSFIKNEKCPHAYLPIVAGGINSTTLHYNTNRCKLLKGDLLLLDFGAEKDGYASDLSRTVPVSGKFTKRQADVYKSVLKIMNQAKKLFTIGNTINQLNETVGLMMEEELVKLNLLKLKDIKKQDKENPLYKKYYMHGTSHFIGLDVHDCGNRDVKFKSGMVLSCEPGIYIKEEGFGIRLENDILVGKKSVDLMQHIPIELEEIEELMNK